jgi:hypothetical protein
MSHFSKLSSNNLTVINTFIRLLALIIDKCLIKQFVSNILESNGTSGYVKLHCVAASNKGGGGAGCSSSHKTILTKVPYVFFLISM